MEKLFLSLRFIVIGLMISMAIESSACIYTFKLYDSYGDGWNGGYINIKVNGVTVASNLTLPSGSGPFIYTLDLNSGDVVSTDYYTGSWPDENYYEVYSQNNQFIIRDGCTNSSCQPLGGNLFVAACPDKDVGMLYVISPVTGCGLTSADSVKVAVVNSGTLTVDTLYLSYSTNGGLTFVNDTIIQTLLPGDSLIYTFPQTVNLSALGDYNCIFTATTPGDQFTGNDILQTTVKHLSFFSTFPYFQNFESGNGGWYSGGINSSWAFGTPNSWTINTAASGSTAWMTNLTGGYNNNEASYVMSPCFDFTGLTNIVFEMKVNYETYWDDGAAVQYTTDGINWIKLGDFQDPGMWYNNSYIQGLMNGFNSTSGWNQTSNGWITVSHFLPQSLAGQPSVRFRIIFGATQYHYNNYDGFAFDDVRIYQPPPMTLSFVSGYQDNFNVVGKGTLNREIIYFNVSTISSTNPLAVTDIRFNTTGTSNTADIAMARVLYTNGIVNYTQFGQDIKPLSPFGFQDTLLLSEGDNYFVLVYDVAVNATTGNFLDAEIDSIKIGGVWYVPTNNNPQGNRQILPAMNGTYVVNQLGGADYTSLAAAVNDLNMRGVNGPVIIDMVPGVYNEKITFDQVFGASSANTITIKSTTNDSSDVTIQDSAINPNENWVLRFLNASNFIVKHLHIKPISNDFGRAIFVGGSCNNLKFLNNFLEGNANVQYSDNWHAIFYVEGTTSDLIVQNNRFLNGSYGLLHDSWQNQSQITNISFNRFQNQYAYGIYIENQFRPVIHKNIIESGLLYNYYYGINAYNLSDSFRITANKIHLFTTGRGLYLAYSYGELSRPGMIANNFITGNQVSSNFFLSGIHLYSNNNYLVVFNSVNIYGQSSQNSYALTSEGSEFNLGIFNNALVNLAGGGYVISITDMNSVFSNYNNFHYAGPNFGRYNNISVPDLLSWQTGTGFDTNSFVGNPVFFSNTDLHTFSAQLNGKAIPIAAILTDIDENPRDLVNPDIGADEFDLPAHEASFEGFTTPVGACGLGLEDVIIRIANNGTAAISGGLTAYYQITGSTVVSQAVTNTILPGDTLDFTFSTKGNFTAVASDTTFEIKGYISLTGDPLQLNDTGFTTVESGYLNPNPVPNHVTINYGNSAVLSVSGPGLKRWYENPSDTMHIHTGDTLITPVLYDTTSYYAESWTTTQSTAIFNSPLGFTGSTSCSGGFMIDIMALNENITINAFDLHCYNTGSQTVNVYFKPGSWVGNATNQAAWTLNGTYVINGQGSGLPSFLAITPQTIPSGQTYSVYLQVYQRYSSLGTNLTYTGNDISIYTGMAHCSNWDGCCSPRGWNGNIYYTKGDVGCPTDRVEVTANVAAFPANDAGIVEIIQPVGQIQAGNLQNVEVMLKNYGLSNLTGVTIAWKLNNVSQTPFTWAGNLSHGSSIPVTIASMPFSAGNNCIEAWTQLPNGQPDVYNLNDTANECFNACLSGLYTIGPVGSGTFDFNSFNSAVYTLVAGGVCGPVIFDVYPGTYQEQVTIPAIPGASATNTVLFRGSTSDSSAVILQVAATSSTANWVIRLNGTSNITFKHMTIRATGTSYGYVVEYINGTNNTAFTNCIVATNNTYTSSYFVCFYSGNNYSNNNISITNNVVDGGYYSIYISNGYNNQTVGLTIKNNIISNYWYYGLLIQYVNNIYIEGNTITNRPGETTVYPVYIGTSYTAGVITGNRILSFNNGNNYGLYLSNCEGSSSQYWLISNNYISQQSQQGYSSGAVYGMFIDNCYYTNFYNNSISIYGGNATQGSAFALYDGYNINILNNIFANFNGGYAYYIYNSNPVSISDYNNIYSTGSNPAYWNINFNTIDQLRNYSGKDLASVSLLPPFTSQQNLDLTNTTLSGRALPLQQVPFDIHGTPRTQYPTIGAHEFPLASKDAGVIAILVPDQQTNYVEDDTIYVKVIIKNFGIDTLFTCTVSHRVNNGTPVNAPYNGSIPVLGTDTMNLPVYTTPAGNTIICAFTTMAGDINTFNDTTCTSYFATAKFDAELTRISPFMEGCGLGLDTVRVIVTNVGAFTIPSGFTCSFKLQNAATTVTETVTSQILPGDSLLFTFNNLADFSTNVDTVYNLIAWVTVPNDPIEQNDSNFASISSQAIPPVPLVTSPVTTNYGSSTLLTATSSPYIITWYDSDTSSNFVGKGFTFQTPVLYDTTTYWLNSSSSYGSILTIGTGTIVNSSTSLPTPYGNWYWGAKNQFLLTASELVALGMKAGNIKSIAFDVANVNSCPPLNNFVILIGNTSAGSLTSVWQQGLTQVYHSSSHQPITGWNTYIFQTPYYWDGSSNIVIETCFNNLSYVSGGNASVSQTSTSFASSAYYANDVNGVCSSPGSGSTINQRPNIRFDSYEEGCSSNRVPVVVNVTAFPGVDAGITQIVNPVSQVVAGSLQEIKVELRNFGTNNLQNVNISWSLNGVVQKTYPWTGSLPHQGMVTVVIDTVNFPGGLHCIKAWTSQPNGVPDNFNLNDTSATVCFSACMSGVYTIGPAASGTFDFNSFGDAIAAMNAGGICGPIVMNVHPGTYNEQLTIPEITGASEVNTITFISSTNTTSSVIVQYSASYAANWVLRFSAAKHVIFKQITLKALNTSYGRIVEFINSCQNITIDSCYLDAPVNTSSYNTTVYSEYGADYNITISNSTLKGGYYSIYYYANSSAKKNRFTLLNNNIIDYYYYGIYTYYTDSLHFEGNFVQNATNSATVYPFYIGYTTGHGVISRNRVISTGSGTNYGLYIAYKQSSSVIPLLISNNFISQSGNPTGTVYGVYLVSCYYINFYNNSVHITGGSASSGRTLYVSSGSQINVVNNILSNINGGYAYYTSSTSAINTSNYNNLYTTGVNIAYWGGVRTTLAALKSYSGKDGNSQNIIPPFTSNHNLALNNTILSGLATPLAAVTNDFFGNPRSANPTIGAHEIPLLPEDAGIVAITLPDGMTSFMEGDTVDVKVVIKNYGTNTLYNIPVNYSINQGLPITATYTGTIPPLMTDTFNMPSFITPAGNSVICAYTNLAGDIYYFNDTTCKGHYAISNIDGTLVEIHPFDEGCALGLDTVKITIANIAPSIIPAGFTVSYQRTGKAVVTETVNTSIPTGDTITYVFNTVVDLSTTIDTTWVVKAWLNIPDDNIELNDTNLRTVLSSAAPPPPTVTSPVSIPFGTSTILDANSTLHTEWYASQPATVPIATGSLFQTPLLYDTTIYWVNVTYGQSAIPGIGYTPGLNIAPQAIASASICNTGPCSTLNDLDLGTCGTQQMWISTSSPPSQVPHTDWISFEWPSPVDIDGMTIHHAQADARFLTGATLYKWENGNWVSFHTFSNLPMQCVNIVPFPLVTTSKLRITSFQMTGNGQVSNPNFREIEIHELTPSGCSSTRVPVVVNVTNIPPLGKPLVTPDSIQLTISGCNDTETRNLRVRNIGNAVLQYTTFGGPHDKDTISTKYYNSSVYPDTTNHLFNTLPSSIDSLFLEITINGYYSVSNAYASLIVDGTFIDIIPDGNIGYGQDITVTYGFGGAQLANWLLDGELQVRIGNSTIVYPWYGTRMHRVRAYTKPAPWATMSQTTGSIAIGDSLDIPVLFSAAGIKQGAYYSNIPIAFNHPGYPYVKIPVNMTLTGSPDLTSDPCLIYTPIFQYTSVTDSITLYNNGCAPLIISDIENSDNTFTPFWTQVVIDPFDSAVLPVVFSPMLQQTYYDTLVIKSNLSDYKICLQGTGQSPPVIVLSTDTITATLTGCNDTLIIPLTISNTGDHALIWTAATGMSTGDQFDSGLNPNIWQSVTGALSGSCGSVSPPNALYFDNNGTRHASTFALNLLGGGNIEFELKIGSGSYPCEQADYGEDVVLEYSIDGGINWVNINTYFTGSFNSFTSVVELIPPPARTQSTILRWRQLSHSGSSFDNWSIDNVLIYNTMHFISVIPDTGTVAALGQQAVHLKVDAQNVPAGNYSGNIIFYSNDPLTPVKSLPVNIKLIGAPDLNILPTTCLVADSTMQWTSSTKTFTILNDGCDTLKITSIYTGTPHYNAGTTSMQLLPFQNTTVNLIFQPQATGQIDDTVYITSNDGVHKLCVTGFSLPAPSFALSTITLTANITICNDSLILPVTVANPGLADLNWTIASVTNPINGSPILWLTANPTSGTVIPSGINNINLKFNALGMKSGSYPAKIRLTSNDPLKQADSILCMMNISGTPDFRLDQPAACIDFDTLIQGNTANRFIKVYNDGCDTLKVYSITNTLAQYQLSTTAMTIQAGDSAQLAVTFIPNAAQLFKDTIHFTANDGNHQVCITGVGIDAPIISVAPVSLSAGFQNCSDSVVLPVKIYNSGIGDLRYNIGSIFGDSYQQTSTKYYTTSGATTNHNFTNVPGYSDSITVILTINGDFNNSSKYCWLHIEGTNIGIVPDNNLPNGTDIVNTYTFTGAQLQSWLNDGILDISVVNTASVAHWSGLVSMHKVEIIIHGNKWISVNKYTDTVLTGDSSTVMVTLRTAGLKNGTYYSAIKILSNDPVNPQLNIPCTVTVNGNASVAFSDQCIHFGTLMQFGSKKDTVEVTNTGCNTLVISSIYTTVGYFTLSASYLMIPPGTSAYLVATFSPTTTGQFSDNIYFSTNVGNYTVCLTGTSVDASVLSVLPASFAKTITACNDTITDNLQVQNQGTGNLTYQVYGGRGLSGDSTVLIISDANPWNLNIEQYIQNQFGIVPDVITSSQVAAANFGIYDIIITVGNQSTTYYNVLTAQVGKFTSFVNSGGIMLYMNANYSVNSTTIAGNVNVLYGNVENQNIIVSATHPIVQGLSNPLAGNNANASYLANLPTNARIITRTNISSVPTTAEYEIGSGLVIATGMLWEYHAGLGTTTYNTSAMLHNALSYALSVIGTSPSWLSFAYTSDTLFGVSSTNVTVKFNSTSIPNGVYTSNIIVYSNDPVTPQKLIPCTLTVNGSAELSTSAACLVYDTVVEGATEIRYLKLYNTGCSNLTVTSIQSLSSEYVPAGGTGTIPSGDSAILAVSFTPLATGQRNSTLNVVTNVGTTQICLEGFSINPPVVSVEPSSFNITINGCKDTVSQQLKLVNTGLGSAVYHILGLYGTDIDQLSTKQFVVNGAVTTHTFTNLPPNVDTLLLEVTLSGDFDQANEFASLNIEGTNIGQINDGNVVAGTLITDHFGFGGSQLSNWLSDGQLVVSVQNEPTVDHWTGLNSFHRVRIRVNGNHWINLHPLSDTIAANDSLTLSVNFFSTNMNAGTHYFNMLIGSNDPGNAQVSVPCTLNVIGDADIWVSHNCLNFDSTMVGANNIRNLSIANTGCDTLKVTQISSNIAEIAPSVSAIDIMPGDTVVIPVIFTPVVPGVNHNGSLYIASNAGNDTLCLTASSLYAPAIQVSQTTFISNLACAISETKTMVIKNTGQANLNYMFSQAGNYFLTITGHTGNILPGDSVTIPFFFNKTGLALGTHSVSFLIYTNDPLNQQIAVACTLEIPNMLMPVNLGPDIFVCSNAPVTLNAGSGYISYLWDDSSTDSARAVTSTGTYYITVTDINNCSSNDTVNVSFYSLPVVEAGADTSVCAGNSFERTATVSQTILNSKTVQIGTGSNFSSSNSITPFTTSYPASKRQMIFRKEELVSKGFKRGMIQSIEINIGSVGDPAILNDFNIGIGTTTAVSLSGGYLGSMTVVYSNTGQLLQQGWNTFILSTPFYYDGMDNLVVELCYTNVTNNYNSSVQYHIAAFSAASRYSYTTNTSQVGCNLTGGTTSSYRPNIRFSGVVDEGIYTWTGPNFVSAAPVLRIGSVTPQHPGFYHLTVDNGIGCISSDAFYLSMSPLPVVDAGVDTFIYEGGSIQLQPNVTGGAPPYSYLWSPAGSLNDPTLELPIASPLTTTTYTMLVTGSNNCVSSDNVKISVIPRYTISGVLTYNNAAYTPMNNTKIYLLNNSFAVNDSVMTDAGGAFNFYLKPPGSYSLRASTPKLWGGVNSTDALVVQRHVINLNPISGLRLKGADVNISSSISSVDALLILRRTLGMDTTFALGDWVYDDPAVLITNANVLKNFQALASGDVNGSYLPPVMRQKPIVEVYQDGFVMPENGTVEIPVRSGQWVNLGAITLMFDLPEKDVVVESVTSPLKGLMYNIHNGKLKIAWSDENGYIFNKGDLILKIRLRTGMNIPVNFWMFPSIESEMADFNAEVLEPMTLYAPRLSKSDDDNITGITAWNVPNPFRDRTTIYCSIPEEGNLEIEVFDLPGRSLSVIRKTIVKQGEHTIEIDAHQWPSGVYYYRITLDTGRKRYRVNHSMIITR